jgi:hypothetical protein
VHVSFSIRAFQKNWMYFWSVKAVERKASREPSTSHRAVRCDGVLPSE